MSSQIALARTRPTLRSAARSPRGAVQPPSLQALSRSCHWPALGLTDKARQVVAVLRLWRRRARDRAELASLDDRMLDDIGLTRIDIMREIGKPFWTE
jgi:uncharacterized protein YjiS (DUF1127 family)